MNTNYKKNTFKKKNFLYEDNRENENPYTEFIS